MTALTAEQAAAIDTAHVVHGADAEGAYMGLVAGHTAAATASGPPPDAAWRWQAGAWQPPAPTLDDLRAIKRAQVNDWRASADRGQFTHGGSVFACDNISRQRIDAVASHVALHGSMPVNWAGYWKAHDNTAVAVPDAVAFRAFHAAMVAQGVANFAAAELLKVQIAAAQNPEQLAAIVWPSSS